MTKRTEEQIFATEMEVLQDSAKRLSKLIPSEAAIADAAGIVREVERLLGETRRKWEDMAVAEMEPIKNHDETRRRNPRERGAPVAVGQQYELVPQFKNIYSYNTQALLVGLIPEGGTVMDALRRALDFDAVRLQWQWTNLGNLLHEFEVPLRMEYREVSDLDGSDGPMVGRVKVPTRPKRVPIKTEEEA